MLGVGVGHALASWGVKMRSNIGTGVFRVGAHQAYRWRMACGVRIMLPCFRIEDLGERSESFGIDVHTVRVAPAGRTVIEKTTRVAFSRMISLINMETAKMRSTLVSLISNEISHHVGVAKP